MVKAPLPHLVRCGACRARLRFDVNLLAVIGVAALALGGLMWLVQPVYARLAGFGVLTAAGLAAAAALALWLAFEIALAWFLLTRRRVYVGDGR